MIMLADSYRCHLSECTCTEYNHQASLGVAEARVTKQRRDPLLIVYVSVHTYPYSVR